MGPVCFAWAAGYDLGMKRAAFLLMWAFSALSYAQAFDLKGFRLGEPMTECPAGSVVTSKPGARQTMCSLGPTTVANQPASDHVVVFSGGAVIGVMIQLGQKGFHANGDVLQALKEKFGAPSSSSKSHLNRYEWESGGHLLLLDGYRGHLMLLDMPAHSRDRRLDGQTNKQDL